MLIRRFSTDPSAVRAELKRMARNEETIIPSDMLADLVLRELEPKASSFKPVARFTGPERRKRPRPSVGDFAAFANRLYALPDTRIGGLA